MVRIEALGNCNIESSIEYSGEYTIIKLTGEKKQDREPIKIEDNLFSSREIGKFSLDIPLKAESFLIKNEKPKCEQKNGLIILEKKGKKDKFSLDDKNKV